MQRLLEHTCLEVNDINKLLQYLFLATILLGLLALFMLANPKHSGAWNQECYEDCVVPSPTPEVTPSPEPTPCEYEKCEEPSPTPEVTPAPSIEPTPVPSVDYCATHECQPPVVHGTDCRYNDCSEHKVDNRSGIPLAPPSRAPK